MSRKRKRKRTHAPTTAAEGEASPDGSTKRSGSQTKQPQGQTAERRRWGRLLQPRPAVASPYPPFGVSLARGLRAVGSTPVVLILAFLGALGAWGAFSAVGTPPSPRLMVNLMALPPVHVYFDLVVTSSAETTAAAVALILGIGAGRAVLFGLLAHLIVGVVRDGKPDVPASLGRLPRTALTLFLLFAVDVAVFLTVPNLIQSIGGPALALLGILATLTLGLHFLVLVPLVAATERGPTAQTIRQSFRAARLPGPRHLLFVVAYFAFVFWAATITPTEALAPATPSALVWAFTLLATFIHASALGALAFRWLAVRPLVVTEESSTSPAP
jgi:hypothetical protein